MPSRSSFARILALCTAILGLACTEDRVDLATLDEMLRRGEVEEALATVREALDRDPTRSELHLLHGRMLIGMRDYHLALFPLREAARDPAYATPARLLIAQTQLATGNSDEALAALEEVLEEDPENRDALILRANANLESMHLQEAIEDCDRLLDENPDDLGIRLVRLRTILFLERVDEAEEGIEDLKTRIAAAPDAYPEEMHARVCVAEAVFLREKGDPAAWHDKAIDCSDRYPSEHVALQQALEAHASRGEGSHAIERVQGALANAPTDRQIRFMLAEHHRHFGDAAAGERVLREGIELADPERSEDWRALYEFFWQLDDFPQALVALERAIELLRDPSTADLLLLADTLVEAGELERAREVAGRLDEGYRDLVLGRIQLERGDLEAARASLRAGIRVWPNNPVARLLLGRIEAKSGRLEEALNEYIEAYRIDYGHSNQNPEKTDSAKEVARIQFALGAYEQAAEFASSHVSRRPDDLEAYELVARAGARGGVTQFIAPVLATLAQRPGGWVRSVALQGVILAESEGPDAAIDAMRRWKPDLTRPENIRVLDTLLSQLARASRHDEAIEVVLRAIAATPETAVFHALSARTLLESDADPATVRASVKEALRLQPDLSAAHLVRGRLEASMGNVEAALAAFAKAAGDPSLAAEARLAAGRLLAAQTDRRDEARTRLEALLASHPLESRAAIHLARLALIAGPSPDLDRALAWAQRSAKYAGALPLEDAAEAYAVLAEVHIQRSEEGRAREALAVALELDGDQEAVRAVRAALGDAAPERS
jgi:tetratricopeptide (TPR) repeat protein